MATKTDYNSMSIAELQALAEEVNQALEAKKEERRKELLAELEALDGTSTGGRGSRRASSEAGSGRARPRAQFRGPNGEEYTGRGAIPRWAKDLGITDKAGLEKYRIKDAA